MARLSPFDFLKSINGNKEQLIVDDITEKEYVPYMVNKGLSYFQDTCLIANEMNIHYHIDHKMQFDFLSGMIRKRQRFSKWLKPNHPEDLDVVKEYYGLSNEKAHQALSLLNDDQIAILKRKISHGGRKI